jgi:hypothetical protein
MANVKQQLETPSLSPLGYPPEVYERLNLNENNGALNIFSRKLTSVLGSLFGSRGGKFMNNPHGAFQDSTDQTAANTTTAYAVTFNTTDFSNGVTLVSGSRFTVADEPMLVATPELTLKFRPAYMLISRSACMLMSP